MKKHLTGNKRPIIPPELNFRQLCSIKAQYKSHFIVNKVYCASKAFLSTGILATIAGADIYGGFPTTASKPPLSLRFVSSKKTSGNSNSQWKKRLARARERAVSMTLRLSGLTCV